MDRPQLADQHVALAVGEADVDDAGDVAVLSLILFMASVADPASST